jgi:hypothetical protein
VPEAGLGQTRPVARDRQRVAVGDPVGGDVVPQVLRAPEEVDRAVAPADRGVDAVDETRGGEAGPVCGDGQRVAVVDLVRRDVVAQVAAAAEEERLAVAPVDRRVDAIGEPASANPGQFPAIGSG